MADTTWTIDGNEAEELERADTPTFTIGTTVDLPLRFETDTQIDSSYPAILDLIEYDAEAVVRRGTTDRGVPWFRERLPAAASVDSLVVSIETGADVIDFEGAWALVVGGDDNSEPPGERRVSIEAFLLAELSEFATKDDVIDAFGDQR